jgi:hypothetical protein
MKLIRTIIRWALIILSIFLALSAIGGGIALVVGFNTPPVADLAGSPFSDYTLPGLALLVVVGGSAVLTAILLIRRHRFATLAALVAGLIIMVFEFVEVLAIAAQVMQIIYFVVGVKMAGLAAVVWFLDLWSPPA